MLNIVTYDWHGSGMRVDDIYLDRKHPIELAFTRVFNKVMFMSDQYSNNSKSQFDTSVDMIMMKEIDRAERKSLLYVRTPEGVGPLTILSTDCKFALLVHYYSELGENMVVSWQSASMRVFELLGREMDITLYMKQEEMLQMHVHYDMKNVSINGIAACDYDEWKLRKDVSVVTSEKLLQVKEWHSEVDNPYTVYIPLSLQCDYKGLDKLFGNILGSSAIDYAEKDSFFKHMQFQIRTTEMKLYQNEKYPIFWVFKKKGDTYTFTLDMLHKYPNFFQIVSEIGNIYEADTKCDEIFVVVYDNRNLVSINYMYSKYIAYSLIYSPHKKEMTIIGGRDTMTRLSQIAAVTEIEHVEICPRKSRERIR